MAKSINWLEMRNTAAGISRFFQRLQEAEDVFTAAAEAEKHLVSLRKKTSEEMASLRAAEVKVVDLEKFLEDLSKTATQESEDQKIASAERKEEYDNFMANLATEMARGNETAAAAVTAQTVAHMAIADKNAQQIRDQMSKTAVLQKSHDDLAGAIARLKVEVGDLPGAG